MANAPVSSPAPTGVRGLVNSIRSKITGGPPRGEGEPSKINEGVKPAQSEEKVPQLSAEAVKEAEILTKEVATQHDPNDKLVSIVAHETMDPATVENIAAMQAIGATVNAPEVKDPVEGNTHDKVIVNQPDAQPQQQQVVEGPPQPNVPEGPVTTSLTQEQMQQQFLEGGPRTLKPVSFEGSTGVDASTLPPQERTTPQQNGAPSETNGKSGSTGTATLNEFGEIVNGTDTGSTTEGSGTTTDADKPKTEASDTKENTTTDEPRKEYWGNGEQPYLSFDTNPDILAIKKSIQPIQKEDGTWDVSPRVQAKIDKLKQDGKDVPDNHTLQNEAVQEAWDEYVAKYPKQAEAFREKDPQLNEALGRKARKDVAERQANAQSTNAMAKTENKPLADDTTEAADNGMNEEQGGFAGDTSKKPAENPVATTSDTSSSLADTTSDHYNQVEASGYDIPGGGETAPRSIPQSSEKDKTSDTTTEEETREQKAFKEITGGEIGYTIDPSDTVGALMQRLTTEKGWQWDQPTVDYVQGAIDYAKRQQADQDQRMGLVTDKSGGEKRNSTEVPAAKGTSGENARVQETMYDDPHLDPAIRALEEEITKRTNLDSAVTKARDGEGGNHTDEWARAESRIAMQQYDRFVSEHPDKAKAYADKDPRMKAALARREEKVRRVQQPESPTQEQLGQVAEERGGEQRASTEQESVESSSNAPSEERPSTAQTENEQVAALEQLVKEQAEKIDKLTDVLTKLQEPMQKMQEAMDIEDAKERRAKMKSALGLILVTLALVGNEAIGASGLKPQ